MAQVAVRDRVKNLKEEIANREGFQDRGRPDQPLMGYKSKIVYQSDNLTALIAEIQPGMQKWGHVHPSADSVVIILEGEGEYILDNANTRPFKPGDVGFAAAGQIHGVHNVGKTTLRYLCVEGPGALQVIKAD